MTGHNSGAEVLREAVRIRSRLPGFIQGLAHDIDIPANSLEHWAAKQRDHFAVPVLEKIALSIFAGHVKYDAEADLLNSANTRPPIAGGKPPEPFKASTASPPKQPFLPRSMAPAKPKVRPGWAP